MSYLSLSSLRVILFGCFYTFVGGSLVRVVVIFFCALWFWGKESGEVQVDWVSSFCNHHSVLSTALSLLVVASRQTRPVLSPLSYARTLFKSNIKLPWQLPRLSHTLLPYTPASKTSLWSNLGPLSS